MPIYYLYKSTSKDKKYILIMSETKTTKQPKYSYRCGLNKCSIYNSPILIQNSL